MRLLLVLLILWSLHLLQVRRLVPVLLPEWLLAFVTYEVWQRGRNDPLVRRALDGILVALMYLGALGIAFLAVERWLGGQL